MRVFCFLLVSLLCVSCDCEEENPVDGNSCKDIIISQTQYQNLDENQASLMEVSLDTDCLKVKLGISGCDDSHEIDMISGGGVNESLPPQIEFDFRDNDPQACLAFIQIEREFDVSEIRTLVDEDIYIRFRNSEIRILLEK